MAMRASPPLLLLLVAACSSFDPLPPPKDDAKPEPIRKATKPKLPDRESLSFTGTWTGITMGGAEFHFHRQGDEYLSEGTIRTSGLVSLLYGVAAKAEAASGVEDLLSRRWSYVADEDDVPNNSMIRFERSSGRVLVIQRKGEKVERVVHESPRALDPLGMVYVLRRAELTVGSSFSATLISRWNLYRLDGKVVGPERIDVPAGEFDTTFVRADLRKLVNGNPEEQSRGLGIWLTDDECRLPVRIDADTKYGRVSLRLEEREDQATSR
jgi:hypothetical protein